MKYWRYRYLQSDNKTIPIQIAVDDGNGGEVMQIIPYKRGLIASETQPDSDYDEITFKEFKGTSLVIKDYQIDSKKDFRVLGKRDLKQLPIVQYTYGEDFDTRGLLLEEKHYYDDFLAFSITYEYELDSTNDTDSQKKIPYWYQYDESIHDTSNYPEQLNSEFIPFSPTKKRKAIYKRRESIIAILEAKTVQLITSGATSEADAEAGLISATNFLAEVSVEKQQYVDTGIPSFLVNKINSLKPSYPFLSEEVAPGVTLDMFVADFLTY